MDGSIYDTPDDLIRDAIDKNLICLDFEDDSSSSCVTINVLKPDEWKSFLLNIINDSQNDFEVKFTAKLLEEFNNILKKLQGYFDIDDSKVQDRKFISIEDIKKLTEILNNSKTFDDVKNIINNI